MADLNVNAGYADVIDTAEAGVSIDFVDRQGRLLLARSRLVCSYLTDSELVIAHSSPARTYSVFGPLLNRRHSQTGYGPSANTSTW